MQTWNEACANFKLFDTNPLATLSSLATYWVALLIACPNHEQLKGIGNVNVSHVMTYFNVVVIVPRFVPSSLT